MIDFKPTKLKELIINFNNQRIPLSARERENLDRIYPYYGAQGIIDYVDKFIFDGEFILVAEDGENLKSQKNNVCTLAEGKFWVNNHAHIIKANDLNNNIFLYYALNMVDFRRYTTGSAQPKLTKDNLGEIVLYIPNLQTQKSIASVLSALDRKIALNNQINQTLEQMAKTLYDYWFVQFDFPDENGKPYRTNGGEMVYNETLKREIPVGWEVKNLWSIAKYFNGLALQKYRPQNESDDFLPVIKIREMNEGISNNTEKARIDIPAEAIIDDGDILFSWSATLEIKIWTQGRGALNQHIFKVTSNKYPKIFYYFELLNYLQHFKMMAELRKTTMGHITQDHLKQAFICIPSHSLLIDIDKKLSQILQQIISLQKQNTQLSQLRDFLLPMLMNGQVSVMER